MHWFDVTYYDAIPGQKCRWENREMDSCCGGVAHVVLCFNRWREGLDVEVTEVPLCDMHAVTLGDITVGIVEDRIEAIEGREVHHG